MENKEIIKVICSLLLFTLVFSVLAISVTYASGANTSDTNNDLQTTPHFLTNEDIDFCNNRQERDVTSNSELTVKQNNAVESSKIPVTTNSLQTSPLDFSIVYNAIGGVGTEVLIDDAIYSGASEYNPAPNVVFLNYTHGYAFVVKTNGGDGEIVYFKTTDGGSSWTGPTNIDSGPPSYAFQSFSSWYDQWTPGNNGTRIHLVANSVSGDTMVYNYLDAANDATSGTWTSVMPSGGPHKSPDGGGAVTVSSLGNIFSASTMTNGPQIAKFNTTWIDITPSYSIVNDDDDHFQLLPLSNGDIIVLYEDSTANSLYSFVYHEDTDQWDPSPLFITTISSDNTLKTDANWGAVLDPDSNDIYLTLNNDVTSPAGDLEAWIFHGDNRTWSQRTNIATSISADEVKPLYNPVTNTLFAAYISSSDSTIYAANSTDGGQTWNTAQRVSTVVADYLVIRSNFYSAERQYIIYFTSSEMYGNTISSRDSSTPVTPPQNAPVFEVTPNDFSYEEDTTGNTLSWTMTDDNPDIFKLYLDDVKLFQSGWVSEVPLEINVDGLEKGVHNYTLQIFNTDGYYANDTAFVTVLDTQVPVFSSSPPDQAFSLGTTDNRLTWVATDNHPSTYTIYRNDVEIDNGNWVSSGSITINIGSLSVGSYNYTIEIFDESNNRNVDEVNIDIVNKPVFTSVPKDGYYGEGTTGNELSWTITSSFSDYYIIYRNQTIVDNNTWSSDVPVTLGIDGLLQNTYNFTIWANTTNGEFEIDTVFVTVTDIPQWVSYPSDFSFNENSTGNSLTWNVTDDLPDTYVILQNSVQIDSGVWTNADEISINIDSLERGIYNFTIMITDQTFNQIKNTVIITVNDVIAPVLQSPGNSTFIEETPNNELSWNASDLHPGMYYVLRNGTQIIQSAWTNGVNISISADGLLKGIYNFTIIIEDDSGNYILDTVYVTILDLLDPFLEESSPSAIFYYEGSSNNTIYWLPYDNYANNYTILLNSIKLESGNWTNSGNITLDIDGYLYGSYNFTIIVYDESLNYLVDTIILKVLENNPPTVVLQPEDLTYPEGSTGNTLSWNTTDSYPSTYVIYRNGTEIQTGNWTNSALITTDIDGLAFGIWNFTLILFDKSNNSIINTVFVSVSDSTNPNLVSGSSDLQYIVQSTGNQLFWTATDSHPLSYTIYRNGSLLTSGNWFNNTEISYNVDNLPIGIYEFTISFIDTAGNIVEDSVIVEVQPIPTDQPLMTMTHSVYEGDIETISGIWQTTEGSGVPDAEILLILMRDGSELRRLDVSGDATGSFVVELDYTSLQSGSYTWSISFKQDIHQNWMDIEYNVTILQHNYKIEWGFSDELVQGQPYDIWAIIYYANNESSAGLGLNSLVSRSGIAEGISVDFNLELTRNDGKSSSISRTAVSDADGKAMITLSDSETLTLLSIDSLSISIKSSQNNAGESIDVPSDSLPEINLRDLSINEQIFLILSQYYIEITAIALLLLFAIFLFIRRRRRKRAIQKELNEIFDVALEELEGIMSIQLVLVISKNGVPVYERRAHSSNVDSILLSGVTTAISSVLEETGDEQLFGIQVMENRGLSITSHKGEKSTLTVISSKKIPLIMMDQMMHLHPRVEDYFVDELTNPEPIQLDEKALEGIFLGYQFKIGLADDLVFDETNLELLAKHKKIGKHTSVVFKKLIEQGVREDRVFKLAALLDELGELGRDRSEAAYAILTAYNLGVIQQNEIWHDHLNSEN